MSKTAARPKRPGVSHPKRFRPEFPGREIKQLYAKLPANATMYVGIDPGHKGAIGFVPSDKTIPPVAIDLPLLKRKVKTTKHGKAVTGTRTTYDFVRICMLMDQAVVENAHRTVVVLERGSPRPEDTGKTAFSVGVGYGMWLLYLAAFNVRVVHVQPSYWKPKMIPKVDGEISKDESRRTAMRAFPGSKHYFTSKGDDGRAEACLVALFQKIMDKKAAEAAAAEAAKGRRR